MLYIIQFLSSGIIKIVLHTTALFNFELDLPMHRYFAKLLATIKIAISKAVVSKELC